MSPQIEPVPHVPIDDVPLIQTHIQAEVEREISLRLWSWKTHLQENERTKRF